MWPYTLHPTPWPENSLASPFVGGQGISVNSGPQPSHSATRSITGASSPGTDEEKPFRDPLEVRQGGQGRDGLGVRGSDPSATTSLSGNLG